MTKVVERMMLSMGMMKLKGKAGDEDGGVDVGGHGDYNCGQTIVTIVLTTDKFSIVSTRAGTTAVIPAGPGWIF